jgi:hypothetical protein
MAKKISKSIVSGLDRLRKVFGGTPEKPPASRKPAASKKSAKRTEPRPPPAPAPAPAQAASQADAAATPEAKPDKKKPAQPWFRHRQRW